MALFLHIAGYLEKNKTFPQEQFEVLFLFTEYMHITTYKNTTRCTVQVNLR